VFGAFWLDARTITLDSESDITISIEGNAGDHGASLEKLLERYLVRALQKESLQGSGLSVEFVIRAEAPTWDKLPRESLRDVRDVDWFEIAITAKPKPRVLISGKTALGAGFGVMQFLEKHVGITWLFPGELGVALPKSAKMQLGETTERASPLYVSRIFSGMLYRDPALNESYLGTFFGSYDYFKSLRLHSLSYASHALVHVFDVKEFGATHPDIYPLKDGRRYIPPAQGDPNDTVGLWSAWHPCYSNPKTTEIAIGKAKQWFEKGQHTFSLGINDGHRVQCQCGDCKKAGWPNAYFHFVTKVADAVKDYYPPHMIGVLAYGDVKIPPPDLKLPENVVVLVTGAETRLETWARHASHVGIYEYFYGDCWWIPNFPLDGLRHNEPIYRALNARFYYAEAYPTWAFDAPKVAIRNRLMWDAKLDVNAALDRYCRAAFGDGGPHMARYYRRWAALRKGDLRTRALATMNRFDLWRNPAGQFSTVSQADFDFADACIAKAKRATHIGPEKARMEMVSAFHESSKNLFQIYSTTRRAFHASAQTDWTQTANALADLGKQRQERYETLKKHPEWFAGTANTLEAAWDEKSLGTLPSEMDAALDACLFHLHGSFDGLVLPEKRQAIFRLPRTIMPETLHPRTPHPWYPSERYDALTVTTNATGIVLRSVPPASTNGQFKSQITAYCVNDMAAHGGKLYKCDLTLTGQDGDATVVFHMGSNNSACPVVQLNETFGRDREERTREVIVRPQFFDSKTRMPDRDVPPDKTYQAVLEIIVTWKPNNRQSTLEGGCAAQRIEYELTSKQDAKLR
jgi:hypothetical protein